jgi:predicted acyltransferase
MPQPRVPISIRVLAFLFSLVPGLLLVLVSLITVLLLVRELCANPRWLVALVLLGIACGIIAWIWSELPLWFRQIVRRLLARKRKDDRQ